MSFCYESQNKLIQIAEKKNLNGFHLNICYFNSLSSPHTFENIALFVHCELLYRSTKYGMVFSMFFRVLLLMLMILETKKIIVYKALYIKRDF